jgi:hypothetical protein
LRIVVCGYRYPAFSSKDMTEYCEKLHRILIDENERLKAIDIAFKVVNQTIESYKMKYPNTNVRSYLEQKILQSN